MPQPAAAGPPGGAIRPGATLPLPTRQPSVPLGKMKTHMKVQSVIHFMYCIFIIAYRYLCIQYIHVCMYNNNNNNNNNNNKTLFI